MKYIKIFEDFDDSIDDIEGIGSQKMNYSTEIIEIVGFLDTHFARLSTGPECPWIPLKIYKRADEWVVILISEVGNNKSTVLIEYLDSIVYNDDTDFEIISQRVGDRINFGSDFTLIWSNHVIEEES